MSRTIVKETEPPFFPFVIEELQRWIQDELEPLSRRNDELARRQRELQRDIVDTWYAWAQELFCDAVGLLMAGPAYLHAFNSYLSDWSAAT
jgi:hypothetical protein